MNSDLNPEVTGFFDPATNTISYVVKDPQSASCAIVDAVMDFDYASGKLSYESADKLVDHVKAHELKLEWLIETHVHADHLSGAPYIQQQLGGKIGIGHHIVTVQEVFGKIFNEGTEFQRTGDQFDHLFADNEHYQIGALKAQAIATPGHTPACMSHVIGDAIFAGDTLFMPDGGTARADFPGGDATTLFASIKKILSYPENTRIFTCHDYGPNGRDYAWESTVGTQRQENIHVKDTIGEQEFVTIRTQRDATLSMPRLIIPSIQVNMRAGRLPDADDSGRHFLKIPINALT